MADDRVEVIIRKRPSFGMPSFSNSSPAPSSYPAAGSPSTYPSYNPSGSGRSSGAKKGLKILALVVVLALVGFGLYKGIPAATSFVLASTGTEFSYTVTAKATETYTDVGKDKIEFIEKSGTKSITLDAPAAVELHLLVAGDLKKETSFTANKGDVIGVNFEYFTDGGGSFKLFKNGMKLAGDLRVTLEGVQLQYEASKVFNVERNATQEGQSKVSRNGKEKQIVEVTAAPKAEKAGELSAVTYEAKSNVASVVLEVRDGWLYAKYVEPAEGAA
ncbi:MAG TPA: hypothetical protein HA282_03020 [Nanoarchaeota archaeon]|nr:MAG: hypothetical protein QT01_C0008G0013 [archaeon GW2011_AR6]MBS3082982.1 hypothetical protein [Candidatus Pacearchaeota archaeon]HIH17378.1 hypothetical protein [Nanoarchaeota archaeon]HIH34703.1 hypothetical protein [Nanoarchaeota archaeon]HIH51155.1 hypothetical protein [Nanoarchaeota archaeon]